MGKDSKGEEVMGFEDNMNKLVEDLRENLYNHQPKKLDKPIKETGVCLQCGRKKTFVFVWQEENGGLWTKDYQPKLYYMECPRCKQRAMVMEDEIKRNYNEV